MKTVIINKNNVNESKTYIHLIYDNIELLEDEYPNFKNWFFNKILPDVLLNNRVILFKEYKKEFVGLSILKSDSYEKKICTFRVLDKFQGIGVGTQLMKNSMDILGTRKPLITVSERRIREFSPLLTKFNFQMFSKYYEYYQRNLFEFTFNGGLYHIQNSYNLNTPYLQINK